MKIKLLFWIFYVVFFGDLLRGAISLALAGNFNFIYIPFIFAILSGVAFTYGLSLLYLIPYFIPVIILYKNRRLLPERYKVYLYRILLVILVMYAVGFIHVFFRMQASKANRLQYETTQRKAQQQFINDVEIVMSTMKSVPQNYRLYEVNLIARIPSKYIGDSKGTILIQAGSEAVYPRALDTYYTYDKALITNFTYEPSDTKISKIVPSFTTNGDLNLTITHFINETDRPNLTILEFPVVIKIQPERSSLNSSVDARFFDLEYEKVVRFEIGE